jgi:hypothetical protein
MTTRESLHQLVDELPEDQAELARDWLQDLRDAAHEGGPPLDLETLASLDRGLADLAVQGPSPNMSANAVCERPSRISFIRSGRPNDPTRAEAGSPFDSPSSLRRLW